MTVVDMTTGLFGRWLTTVSILVVVDDGRRLSVGRRFPRRSYRFQSLLLWMTVVDSSAAGRSSWGKLFQSLLLWMTVVDETHRALRMEAARVSILVVVDDGRRRSQSVPPPLSDPPFQSLLLWMTVVDFPSRATASMRSAEFQSLLLWMTVVDGAGRDQPAIDSGFQSLLLWMTVVDRPPRSPLTGPYTGFNPCCCG